MNKITYSEEARKKLKSGVDKVANAVKTTLGPKGRNAMIGKGKIPIITNDGVTIAKSIELEDPIENVGAQVIKEVASRANEVGGDGTTTATLLAQVLVSEGIKNVTAGANPMALKRGLEKGWDKIDDILAKMSIKATSKEKLVQVATISAEDEKIGKIIADVIDKVGQDGIITVEESQGFEVEHSIEKGFQMEEGYMSPYFITNPEKQEVILEDVLVLVTADRVVNVEDVMPLLEMAKKLGNKGVAVFAEDIMGDALATLIVNKVRGGMNSVAVKMPIVEDARKDLLEDIATATGAEIISNKAGSSLKLVTTEQLGQARKIISAKDHTIILEGKGEEAEVQNSLDALKTIKDNVDSDFDKERQQERIARLSGGIGVIRVGAMTEIQQKSILHKIEDAVNATKVAVSEGILPGGGVALLRAGVKLGDFTLEDKDENVALDILKSALKAPLYQIAENAGMDGAVIVDKVLNSEDGIGYNAQTNTFENMVKCGIIDPARVVRASLDSAVSATSMFLTTEVVITKEEETE